MKLQRELKLTYLFIAHDLSMVKHISDKVGVMYMGRIVEMAASDELYSNPMHPYTKALLSAIKGRSNASLRIVEFCYPSGARWHDPRLFSSHYNSFIVSVTDMFRICFDGAYTAAIAARKTN